MSLENQLYNITSATHSAELKGSLIDNVKLAEKKE
jgi:hypothetical protein